MLACAKANVRKPNTFRDSRRKFRTGFVGNSCDRRTAAEW
jgi:hypothetical protein